MSNKSNLKWKLREITLVAVLSIALGVIWWGWTFIYNFFDPFLKPFGLNYLVVGFWFIGGTLLPYIIRKPGAAIFAESLGGLVEGFITQWGITALLWGAVQGAFAEAIFALFSYKKYGTGVMILAGVSSAIGSYLLDFIYSKYFTLGINIIVVQIFSIIVSGAILGGLLAKMIGDGLKKTGVLNQFMIVQDIKDEVSTGSER